MFSAYTAGGHQYINEGAWSQGHGLDRVDHYFSESCGSSLLFLFFLLQQTRKRSQTWQAKKRGAERDHAGVERVSPSEPEVSALIRSELSSSLFCDAVSPNRLYLTGFDGSRGELREGALQLITTNISVSASSGSTEAHPCSGVSSCLTWMDLPHQKHARSPVKKASFHPCSCLSPLYLDRSSCSL